jgi:hypothetical protein
MKRLPIGILVFLLMLWFSGNSVHAKNPNRLQVISAVAYISDSKNSTIEIYALNFGDDPQVKLGDNKLINITFEDQTIYADLPTGILPGTYRLSVARSGVEFSHPEKADSLDVTISNTNSDPKSGDPGEPSGALERGNIDEIIIESPSLVGTGNTTINCSCHDKNDIALNGGYKIKNFPPGCTCNELTILESNMYYSEDGNDYYQLVVNPPSPECQGIKIDAYLRCIKIPGE